jgi:hypothetical protein
MTAYLNHVYIAEKRKKETLKRLRFDTSKMEAVWDWNGNLKAVRPRSFLAKYRKQMDVAVAVLGLLGMLIVSYLLVGFPAGIPLTSYSSVASGGWDTPTTWNPNGVPVAGDDVTINAHAITLQSNSACATLTINSGGSLDTTTNNYSLTVSGVTTISGTLTCNGSTISLGSGVIDTTVVVINSGGVLNGGTGPHTYGNIHFAGTWYMSTGGTTINGESASDGTIYRVNPGISYHQNSTVTITSSGSGLTHGGIVIGISTATTGIYNLIINSTSTTGHIEIYMPGNVSIYNNLTVVNTPSAGFHFRSVGGTYTCTIGGNFTISAGLVTTVIDATPYSATVIVNGTTSVSGTFTTYSSLITLNGAVTVNSGGTLGSNTGYTLDVNGAMTVYGTINAPNSSGAWYQSGNLSFDASSTINANGGTLTFDGSCNYGDNSSASTGRLNKVIVNSGVTVTLTGSGRHAMCNLQVDGTGSVALNGKLLFVITQTSTPPLVLSDPYRLTGSANYIYISGTVDYTVPALAVNSILYISSNATTTITVGLTGNISTTSTLGIYSQGYPITFNSNNYSMSAVNLLFGAGFNNAHTVINLGTSTVSLTGYLKVASGTSYWDVTVNTSGTITVSDTTDISGKLIPSDGATLTFNGAVTVSSTGILGDNTGYTLDINANLTVNTGGTLNLPNSSGAFYMSGSAWYMGGTVNHNNGTTTFDRSGTTYLYRTDSSSLGFRLYDVYISAGTTLRRRTYGTIHDPGLYIYDVITVAGVISMYDAWGYVYLMAPAPTVPVVLTGSGVWDDLTCYYPNVSQYIAGIDYGYANNRELFIEGIGGGSGFTKTLQGNVQCGNLSLGSYNNPTYTIDLNGYNVTAKSLYFGTISAENITLYIRTGTFRIEGASTISRGTINGNTGIMQLLGAVTLNSPATINAPDSPGYIQFGGGLTINSGATFNKGTGDTIFSAGQNVTDNNAWASKQDLGNVHITTTGIVNFYGVKMTVLQGDAVGTAYFKANSMITSYIDGVAGFVVDGDAGVTLTKS